jgi:phage protein D
VPETTFSVQPRVKVDGTDLDTDVLALLEEVIVDDHLHLPDMFLISLRDVAKDAFAKAHLRIGSKIEIASPAVGGSKADRLISGEVTALEAEYDSAGSRAVARGYDQSHRLQRGRHTETYRNVKDSDIARKVAQRHKLEAGVIDDSRMTHEHVSQCNLSDFEFLKARARAIGFEMAVAEGKLDFRKPAESSAAPPEGDFNSENPLQLVFGQDLLEFRPRVSSAEQVSEVKVRGWDPKEKKALIGSAQASSTSYSLPTGPSDLASKFGAPDLVAVDRVPSTQTEAEAAARALAEQIGSAGAEADGIARGNPKLKAGTAVSISAVADAFGGRYTLTHTRHVFDTRGYRTLFEVSGRQERSLLGLVSAGSNGSLPGGPPIYGTVVAQVTNNDDPEHLGRLKLKFPWLADGYESDWARLVQLGAGPDSGAVFIPEVNDEVLVAFEFGDVRRPFVIGGLYNGKDKPRLGSGLIDNGKVKRRGFVSRKGHRAVFFDGDGKSGIALLTSDGNVRVSLKEDGGGKIHLYCQGPIHLESKQGIKVEAQTQLELSGQAGVKITSSGPVEVSGTPIKLN